MKEHLKVVAEWLGCIAACVALGAAPVLMDTDEPEPPQAAEFRASLERAAERAEFERLAAEQTQRDQQEVIAAMQGAQ